MRQFVDRQGVAWDAAVEFGSFGLHVVVFGRRDGQRVLKAPLPAASRLEANQALADMEEPDLQSLLDRAVELHEDLGPV